MFKKVILFVFSIFALISFNSCAVKMLPAEDIDVFNYCAGEIAILNNPRIPTNSKEKYYAARSLSNKVDFSYARTTEFLNKIFYEGDARVSSSEDLISILLYYQYEDKYVSFEFKRVENDIIFAEVKRN